MASDCPDCLVSDAWDGLASELAAIFPAESRGGKRRRSQPRAC